MPHFDARQFATAWLSVALASDKDLSPSLDRAVLLEQYPEGIRLVATDRITLLTSWVADLDDVDTEAPGLDEAPIDSVVLRDYDRRAASLLTYCLGLTAGDDYEVGIIPIHVRLDEFRPAGGAS